MPSEELLSYAYQTRAGEGRRVRVLRTDESPWRVERVVEQPDGDDGWREVGREELTEIVINGEHRAPKTLLPSEGRR